MMDEEGPLRKTERTIGQPLLTWDVAELRDYIAVLQAEILRAQAAIDRKQGHKQAAEAFFRLPGEPS